MQGISVPACTRNQPSFTAIPKICVLSAGYLSEVFYIVLIRLVPIIPHHLVEEGYLIKWCVGFLSVGLFIQLARVVHGFDPNADPDHVGSARSHWSGEVRKAPAPVTNSTRCTQKRPLNFQSNLRDQEAAGSSPATPAIENR